MKSILFTASFYYGDKGHFYTGFDTNIFIIFILQFCYTKYSLGFFPHFFSANFYNQEFSLCNLRLIKYSIDKQ